MYVNNLIVQRSVVAATARILQHIPAEHCDDRMSTLGAAQARFKEVITPGVHKKVIRVSSAASYDRHQIVVDRRLINDVREKLNSAKIGGSACNAVNKAGELFTPTCLNNVVAMPNAIPPPFPLADITLQGQENTC